MTMLIMSVAELKKRYKRGERNFENIDLEGADLQGIELPEIDLTGANFKGANLTDCNLQKACLNRANFSEAILIEADFDGASLVEANLDRANLANASLNETKLMGVLLTNGASLKNAYLISAFLNNARLTETVLDKANLMGAYLNGAFLKKVSFKQALLTGCYYNSKTEFDRDFDPIKVGMLRISDEIEPEKTSIAELLSLFNIVCECSCKYLGAHLTVRYLKQTKPNLAWLEEFNIDRSGKVIFVGLQTNFATRNELQSLQNWMDDYRNYCSRIIPEFSKLI
jgi:Pentapeptide repeats (8 copies)